MVEAEVREVEMLAPPPATPPRAQSPERARAPAHDTQRAGRNILLFAALSDSVCTYRSHTPRMLSSGLSFYYHDVTRGTGYST